MEKFVIYTDGGARGNPGPAAIGVVVEDAKGHVMKEYGEDIGDATNNIAEYEAAIFALKKLKQLLGKERCKNVSVEIRMDSELVVQHLNGKYKIKEPELIPRFIALWNLKQDFGAVHFVHVPREKNRAADRLVNQALDQESQKLF